MVKITVHGASPTDHVFDHSSGRYNVTQIKRAIAQEPELFGPVKLPIIKEWAEHLERNHGVEEEWVRGMSRIWRDEPIVVVMMPDEKMLVIDGNHRYVRRYRDGLTEVTAWVVAWETAQQFMVTVEMKK